MKGIAVKGLITVLAVALTSVAAFALQTSGFDADVVSAEAHVEAGKPMPASNVCPPTNPA